MSLRAAKTIAACQRFSGVTKNAPALQYQEENRAVQVPEFCKSFPLHIKLPIASSAHLSHRTSLVFVVGVIAFLSGRASSLLLRGLIIHSLKNRLLGRL